MAEVQLAKTSRHVVDNLLRLHSYALGSEIERSFHFDRIFNAEHQVYYQTSDGPLFAPVKWCGARKNDIAAYWNNKFPVSQVFQRALRGLGFLELVEGNDGYDRIYREFISYCRGLGFKNSAAGLPHSNSRSRTFWALEFTKPPSVTFPDELPIDTQFFEGAAKNVSVNAFERNSAARLACIAHFGWACQACGLDFEQRYGVLGSEFIHVHHIRPLSELRIEYEVNPVKDLRPVCPNCHAMIHRSDPPLSVEVLAKLISERA
jgi:HNH endonuclease